MSTDERCGITAKERIAQGSALNDLVMCDIKASMKSVVDSEPILNAGSFALTLLWQIFEAAGGRFERYGEVNILTDDEIESAFKESFPVFIAEYPNVMTLDT